METSARCPIFDGYRHNGITLLRDTLATWEKMQAAGMRPTSAGNGTITMTDFNFRKAFAGRPATQSTNKNVVCLSVWDGHVEITCMIEKKSDPLSEVVV